MEYLNGKTALVIGGSSGIGLAIGRALAEDGATVVLTGRSQEKLAAATERVPSSRTHACDVTDREALANLVSSVETELGGIDILVYSAGTNVARRSFADIDPIDFDRVVAANATGAFNAFHAVLPGMRERGKGVILNIVSLAGLRNLQLAGVPYCASKFAQASIGTVANLEALPEGVSVTNIYPGETETPILDQRPEPPSAERRAQMIQPDDIAALAVAVARLPARATVPEIVITPRHMPIS